MRSWSFNFLTPVFFFLSFGGSLSAGIFKETDFKTHLRWTVTAGKDQILIKTDPQKIELETLNLDLFNQMVGELGTTKLQSEYFKELKYSKDQFPDKPATISVNLKDSAIEIFSFYKEGENIYVLDFWIDQKKREDLAANTKMITESKNTEKPSPELTSGEVAKKIGKIFKTQIESNRAESADFRDFRYGTQFIWDYPAMAPQLDKDFDLTKKIPMAFYELKDRVYTQDEKEAHMQLSINLYRQEKWGYLSKSLSLYEKKFGIDSNWELNQFLKANVLLKENIQVKSKSAQASANTILLELVEKTEDYELFSASIRYLLQYSQDQKDFVNGLALAQKYFIRSKQEVDNEATIRSSHFILNALAMLNQIEKIGEFVGDKTVSKIIPRQISLAYELYGLLQREKPLEVISRFEKYEKQFAQVPLSAILFNAGESYFRMSQYQKAVALFDSFIKNYGHTPQASQARLRLALIYDLLEKPHAEVLTLYKSAIDRSPYPETRLEAKIRYVGLKVARNKNLAPEDRESVVYLELSEDEKANFSAELKKAMWLTRLRTYLSLEQYQEALEYLELIPLNKLNPVEQKIFQEDGAEVVFGIVKRLYNQRNYAQVIKTWELYRARYEEKVAPNPEVRFLVCDSFLQTGLTKGFKRHLQELVDNNEATVRTYPLWVKREAEKSPQQYLLEIDILWALTEKDWNKAESLISQLSNEDKKMIQYDYYNALISFHQKKWESAEKGFETLLISQDTMASLQPNQISQVLIAYTETLSQLGHMDKLKKTGKALLSDMEKNNNPYYQESKERVTYLLIESLLGDSKPAFEDVEELSGKFLNNFANSVYYGRVKYILGKSYIGQNKVKEGRVLFEEILKDEKTSSVIKEMTKTELVNLELKNRTL